MTPRDVAQLQARLRAAHLAHISASQRDPSCRYCSAPSINRKHRR